MVSEVYMLHISLLGVSVICIFVLFLVAYSGIKFFNIVKKELDEIDASKDSRMLKFLTFISMIIAIASIVASFFF